MSKLNKVVLLVLLLLVIILGALAVYQQKQLDKLGQDPQALAQQEIEMLVAEVGRIIVLPTDEQPTVATVSDAEALREQPFFAKAENGFRVLIYTNARKAILYDPINKKIVEVAPISLGQNQGAPTGSGAESSEE